MAMVAGAALLFGYTSSRAQIKSNSDTTETVSDTTEAADPGWDEIMSRRPMYIGTLSHEQLQNILNWENELSDYAANPSSRKITPKSTKADATKTEEPVKTAAPSPNVISVEYIRSEMEGSSYFRGNASYSLPFKIKGYTFGEFYSDGESYFSKSTLSRSITDILGVQAQAAVGSGMTDRFGLGLNVVIPTPKGTFAKVYDMPGWVDATAKKVDNTNILGYIVSLDLPEGFSISSFGEMNIAGNHGVEWCYGEIFVKKQFEDFSVSYNPALLNDGAGKAAPTLQHRINFEYLIGR